MLSWLRSKKDFQFPKTVALESQIVITRIISETTQAKTFEFRRLDGQPLKYTAGQYIGLKIRKNSVPYLRQYSLSSSPEVDSAPAFTVKRVPEGMWSNFLIDHAQEGNVIEIDAPKGAFVLSEKPAQKLLLFAAGSGITPVYSILKSFLSHADHSRSVMLFYSNQNREQIIFDRQLRDFTDHDPRLQVFHFLSKETHKDYHPKLDEHFVKNFFEGDRQLISSSQVYICGVPTYVNEIKSWLDHFGIEKDNVFSEAFVSAPSTRGSTKSQNKTKKRGAPVQTIFSWHGNSRALEGSDETSVLDTALEADLPVSWACLNGVCGSCEMSLKRGQVKQGHQIINAGDKFLSCVSVPLGPEVECSFK